MKKLKLVTPKVIDTTTIDPILLMLGIAVIGIVIYMGVRNGPGRVIEASDRFTNKSNGIGNANPDGSGKTE